MKISAELCRKVTYTDTYFFGFFFILHQFLTEALNVLCCSDAQQKGVSISPSRISAKTALTLEKVPQVLLFVALL